MLSARGKTVVSLVLGGAAIAAGACAAHSATYGFTLSLQVPVMCTVRSGAAAGAPSQPGSFELGSLREYCNAPRGYDLVVRYTPGTLKGMTLIAGEARVLLDGSGTATIDGASGPSVKNRNLEAIPGPGGFDADHLDFDTVVTPF